MEQTLLLAPPAAETRRPQFPQHRGVMAPPRRLNSLGYIRNRLEGRAVAELAARGWSDG
jgi:hypothetical protein